MEFFQTLDAILRGIALILLKYGLMLGVMFSILFVAIGTIVSVRADAKRDAEKERAKAEREKAINEGLAKGVLPEEIRELLDGKVAKNAKNKKLTAFDQTHLDLLSGFTGCAYKIRDTAVSDAVFELGALVDLICKRLKSEKQIVGSMKDFVSFHAPETLKVATAYQQLAAKAMTPVLHAELANTAAVLRETKEDFVAYLAKYEEGEAIRLAILSRTRQMIGKMERPHVTSVPAQAEALPPPDDLLGLTGSGVRTREHIQR